jgi:hypothetical protein
MDPDRLKSIPLFASLSDEGRREVSILAASCRSRRADGS